MFRNKQNNEAFDKKTLKNQPVHLSETSRYRQCASKGG